MKPWCVSSALIEHVYMSACVRVRKVVHTHVHVDSRVFRCATQDAHMSVTSSDVVPLRYQSYTFNPLVMPMTATSSLCNHFCLCAKRMLLSGLFKDCCFMQVTALMQVLKHNHDRNRAALAVGSNAPPIKAVVFSQVCLRTRMCAHVCARLLLFGVADKDENECQIGPCTCKLSCTQGRCMQLRRYLTPYLLYPVRSGCGPTEHIQACIKLRARYRGELRWSEQDFYLTTHFPYLCSLPQCWTLWAGPWASKASHTSGWMVQ